MEKLNVLFSNPLQSVKIAGTALGAIVLLVLVSGLLNVLDSVPLLSSLLNLIALYYLYKDKANVLPKLSALSGETINALSKALPPTTEEN